MSDMSVFKIIVLGDSTVGKTNLIARFCYNQSDAGLSILDHFKPSGTPTVAIEFCTQDIKIQRDGRTITGKIWDTAGKLDSPSNLQARNDFMQLRNFTIGGRMGHFWSMI
jgi:GTPase SAR1 family protein